MQCGYMVRGSKNTFSTYFYIIDAPLCSAFLKRFDFYKAHRSETRHALIAVYLVCVTEMLLPLPCWLPKQLIFIVFVTKTIKPIINEAFVAFSEDVITDYNDLL